MKQLIRTKYLDEIAKYLGVDTIKTITGMRRVGKSTIMRQFAERLLESGVQSSQIQFINFENPLHYRGETWREMFDAIYSHAIDDKMNYIFVDEPQHLEEYEKLLDGLYVQENIDLYLTGSNSKLLSSELATILTGRQTEIHVYPLSFAEYLEMNAVSADAEDLGRHFNHYLLGSWLPGAFAVDDSLEYSRSVLESIIEKDIYSRHNVYSKRSFDNIAKYVLQHLGSPLSPNRIAKALKSDGKVVDNETVEKYISYLKESYILYEASRFDIKGKGQLATLEKYYPSDMGFRNAVLGKYPGSDIGHILESIVYLELLRRKYRVWVGKVGESEIDFVVKNSAGDISYYQVSASVIDDSTYNREVKPFYAVKDFYPKILLTTDDIQRQDNGILHYNLYEWLLSSC